MVVKMKRQYLLKKDSEDLRDQYFTSSHFKMASLLPKLIDLRTKMPAVFDQGQLGSCTANALVGLRQYCLLQNKNLNSLSRLFLYYEERSLKGTINEDSGAELRDGMKVLQQTGCCPEKDFPYDITKFTNKPTYQALKDAAGFKIISYQRVADLISLKTALAHNLPVALGIAVYDSFESDAVAQTGIVPMPDTNTEECLGGHAVLAVGYDDVKGRVIVRNSWGSSWGDKGYFYLPYAFIQNADLTSDMWTGK